MMRGQIKKNVAEGSGGRPLGSRCAAVGRRAVPVRNDDDNWRLSDGGELEVVSDGI